MAPGAAAREGDDDRRRVGEQRRVGDRRHAQRDVPRGQIAGEKDARQRRRQMLSRPTPRLLFENKSVSGASAMVPKGENGAEKTPREQINVTLNWFEELKQRVPVK